jgi:chromosome segregation protein
MYLKSLVLRGFKSFAEKSVMRMEPGIMAVVGPNGSGKSNISDAVLWVLGERNAKNLRGNSMEDVIFAGSGTRRATSMAEVELVLDNSDETLAVDYTEISIARRMYRDGRNEYLLNGSVCRRMDIMDVLHDAGLGAGAHSIISQGSLEEVLKSKPVERRALIEEAAGVLKHKQRLERSSKKLDRLLLSTSRINDVATEVERQLKPLARKAARARTYTELNGELTEINIDLAVERLRAYKREWEETEVATHEMQEAIAGLEAACVKADAAVEAASEEIREKTRMMAEVSERYRHFARVADRLDATIQSLHAKVRTLTEQSAAARARMDAGEGEIAAAEAASVDARRAADEAESQKETLDTRVRELTSGLNDVVGQISGVSARLREARNQESDFKGRADRARNKVSVLNETLAKSSAKLELLEERRSTLDGRVSDAQAEAEIALAAADADMQRLGHLEAEAANARDLVAKCGEAQMRAREDLEAAREALAGIKAGIEAINEIEQNALKFGSEARSSLTETYAKSGRDVQPLSHFLDVDPKYEAICERALGDMLDAFIGFDATGVLNASQMLKDGGIGGSASFLYSGDMAAHIEARPDLPQSTDDLRHLGLPGVKLLDFARVQGDAREAVEALLQSVVVCDTFADALTGHAQDTVGLDFYSIDGQSVRADGRVYVGGFVEAGESGTLARQRHLAELNSALEGASARVESAAEVAKSAEEAARGAQVASLSASEAAARAKGDADSAVKKVKDAQAALEAACAEKTQIEKQVADLTQILEGARPDIDAVTAEITELEASLAAAVNRRDEAQSELSELRRNEDNLKSQLNAAKLDLAKQSERAVYEARVAARYVQDLALTREKIKQAEAESTRKAAAAERLRGVIGVFDALSSAAMRSTQSFEQAASATNAESSELDTRLNEARSQAKSARGALEAKTDALTDIKIKVARLEVQVQNAVADITENLGVSIEAALARPQIDNVEVSVARAEELKRKIANLGTINPDAAEQYDELSRRYDFLAGQLADLKSATTSLKRINRIITDRIQTDFDDTFAIVNANFGRIFESLFPGGHAYLTLEDVALAADQAAEGNGDLATDGPNAQSSVDRLQHEAGIEVHAQPAGKRIAKMSLMSGGEKSLTALALLFAIYTTNNAPFYILDEVEAALDDTNLMRLVDFVDSQRNQTQIIMITHQRRTMEAADVLFGVSMGKDGVTKVISQKLEAALKSVE